MIEHLNRTYKASYRRTNTINTKSSTKWKCCMALTTCRANSSFSSSLASRPSWICRKTVLLHRSGAVINRTVEYRSRQLGRLWGYAAKVCWHKAHGLSCLAEKGLILCGFLGQRPKPSESFSESISTVFKVHLSLFFSTQFFINYLTLPCFYLGYAVIILFEYPCVIILIEAKCFLMPTYELSHAPMDKPLLSNFYWVL